MKLNALVLSLVALSSTAALAEEVQVPAECKNLALMAGQLLSTGFNDGQMTGSPYNPSHLTLRTSNGLKIGKITYLGGDGDENGTLPCEKDATLCTNPAGAGGSIDWAKVEVQNSSNYTVAEVIVSMGSRGGCTISSAKVPPQN